jgi:hypothetical protein
MISSVELFILIAIAVVLGQCLAWLVQLVAWRSMVTQVVQLRKSVDRAPFRSFWAETTKAHFHSVRRRTRYQVYCPVLYQIDGEAKHGIVVDMTRAGWRIKGRGHISVGTVMSLTISLPGNAAPVPISRGVVRWSEGEEFGISLVAFDQGPAVQSWPTSSVPSHLFCR